jgi:hypothetical protein
VVFPPDVKISTSSFACRATMAPDIVTVSSMRRDPTYNDTCTSPPTDFGPVVRQNGTTVTCSFPAWLPCPQDWLSTDVSLYVQPASLAHRNSTTLIATLFRNGRCTGYFGNTCTATFDGATLSRPLSTVLRCLMPY